MDVLEGHQLLDRYRTHLLRDHHREQETFAGIRRTLTSFWDHAAKPPHRVTGEHLDRFLYDRSLADATRATYASRIKAAYRWWHAVELLDRDPLVAYAVPPVHPGPARSLQEQQIVALIAYAYNQPRLHTMVWLAYGAGLRAAEIARMRIEDTVVHGPRPHLRVHGKGRRERLVWLHPEVAEILAGALVGRPQTGPLIQSETHPGTPISPSRVSRLLGAGLRASGTRASSHQLRHTFATFLLAEGHGRNLHALMRLLGHASVATTERYVRAYDQDALESSLLLPILRPGPRRLDAS